MKNQSIDNYVQPIKICFKLKELVSTVKGCSDLSELCIKEGECSSRAQDHLFSIFVL